MDWYRLLVGVGAFVGLVTVSALGSWLPARAPGAGADPEALRKETLEQRVPGEGCDEGPGPHHGP